MSLRSSIENENAAGRFLAESTLSSVEGLEMTKWNMAVISRRARNPSQNFPFLVGERKLIDHFVVSSASPPLLANECYHRDGEV
jgi:hypothetical protein